MTLLGTSTIRSTQVYCCNLINCTNTITVPFDKGLVNDFGWYSVSPKFGSSEYLHFCCEKHLNTWLELDKFDKSSQHIHRPPATAPVQVPTVQPEQGLQTKIDVAFHRLDPRAMLALGGVLGFGEAKYQYVDVPIGQENWRKISHLDHVNHALNHLFHYLLELQEGPAPQDDEAGQHLDHALCRIMFAKGVPYDGNTKH